ncbi:uncharacterized protein [Montipora capricornis]|uniref:uncharacterized protein n=1 Tax=Montipora capricornis TaxID=246305 RepID=UPI0035F1BDDD
MAVLTSCENREYKVIRILQSYVTMRRLPVVDFIIATENAICLSSLNEAKSEFLRSKVCDTLRKNKARVMNLNKDEGEALDGLTKHENVVILPADKGSCLVVLNCEDYDQKCKSLLNDKKNCKPIGYNPTNGLRKKVCAFTNKIYTEGTINVDLKRKLDPPSEPSEPAFYGLPKIHKPEPSPLRPIVSSIGSVTYNLAKHAAYILRPLVCCSSHHLKNTPTFAEKVREIKLTTEETITSYNVSALFTSIPPDEAITTIRQRLEKDEILAERTCLSIEEVVELVDICLTTTYFSFKGKFYKQIHGCAMGSPISPIVANLCMEVFEERA